MDKKQLRNTQIVQISLSLSFFHHPIAPPTKTLPSLSSTHTLTHPMASLLPNLVSVTAPSTPILFRPRLCSPSHGRPPPRRRRRRLLRSHFSTASASKEEEPSLSQLKNRTREQPPRTLFPGGFHRPEIQVPTVVLQLDAEEVLDGDEDAVSAVDKAVSKPVGIVVLGGGEGSGGRLYEAACLLKSVIRDRAYLLIAERVDIAAAVNASGVVLSDHGLPAIVARCMMMDSKPESVVLPLVGRRVQTANAALNASNSEGADFLIYDVGQDMHDAETSNSVIENVKIPIFFMVGKNTSVTQKSHLCSSGVSGFVISLEVFRLPIDSVLGEFLDSISATHSRQPQEVKSNYNREILGVDYNSHSHGKMGIGSFIKLGSKEKQLLETESSVLLEAINVIKEAAPLMKEVSLLIDAVSQLDEPFLLAIVGEFNSGKSSVINALLGRRYLKEGVIPTTNEITFLCHSSFDSNEKQHCEWHPDGRFICYLPAPILQQMTIVDTPGTNVILKRQQRLTEEFMPRADLLLFVMSADRPLTESEVTFLRYAQRWKKKVVFVLNKSDLYQNAREHKEAISFVKENAQKLLNTEEVTLFSVSARSALEAKLLASSDLRENLGHISSADSLWRANGFDELEKFLYSFIDGSTNAGIERIRLKLETPIGIADHMLSACDAIVRKECQYAQEDLFAVNEIVSSVRDFKMKMQSKSSSWRGQTLSLVNATKDRVVKVIESTLQLSNLDLIASYVFKGDKSSTMPAASTIQNDIIGPALSDTRKLLAEYALWLETNSAQERRLYKESFERRWPSFVYPQNQVQLKSTDSLKNEVSLNVINNFSVRAASKLFEQEIREVFLGTFGGLGVAGLSASLLTSVLPTTLEDLLALGLCSTGGYLAISKFPTRRQEMVNKVERTAESLACKLDEAMQKDLLETFEELENFVRFIGKPYEEAAQNSVDRSSAVQGLLSDVDKKVRTLRVQIQNLHV